MPSNFFQLNHFKKIFPLVCFFWGVGARAQADSTAAQRDTVVQISEVIIKSLGIQEKQMEVPAAVSTLDQQELKRNSSTLLTESFNRKPGVFVQSGALNTSRITLRGIGARAQYGTNRVKAYFDGIPISTAGEQTVLNDIDLKTLDHIAIIKGPNSSIYGSGLGGVIALYSLQAEKEHSQAAAETRIGSYGLFKESYTAIAQSEKTNFFATYNHLKNDGFRENSAYDRKSFTFHGNLKTGKANGFSILGNYTHLKAHIPSSLDFSTFKNHPGRAAENWKAAKGFEEEDKFLLGVSYKHKFSDAFKNKTSIFIDHRDNYEPRPFDILKEKSFTLGARTQFNSSFNWGKVPLKASLGGEFLNTNYQGSKFDNLYEDFPGNGSIRGKMISNNEQRRVYNNIFVQLNAQFSKKLKLVGGLNVNFTNYSLTDLFVDANDRSGDYRFKTVWSPRIAAVYKLSKNKNLYLNISKGFSIPTVEETLTPSGHINTSLKPETGLNYEIGFKGNWFKNLYTEISAYTVQVSDLLVARRVAEDQYVGINAGKTNHNGVEILVNYKWKPGRHVQFNPYFSASFNGYKFEEFSDKGETYDGNKLTGVPDKKINFGLDVGSDLGFRFFSNFLYVSAIPLNDANTRFSAAYKVVDFKIRYQLKLLEALKINFSVGVNNAFNEDYAASILPNAVGFDGSAPRYYYPGMPRNFFGGVGLNYLF